MILHIVRHAEAIEASADIPEPNRYLTSRGRTRFRRAAKTLRKLGVDPELIFTSPLVRCVQTAEILAQVQRFKGDLLATALLAPGFQPESLDQLLAPYPYAAEIAIVGHEPDVGRLAQTLLDAGSSCSLKKGSILTVQREPGDKGSAQFVRLVTGGGKVVTSVQKALERLQNS